MIEFDFIRGEVRGESHFVATSSLPPGFWTDITEQVRDISRIEIEPPLWKVTKVGIDRVILEAVGILRHADGTEEQVQVTQTCILAAPVQMQVEVLQ